MLDSVSIRFDRLCQGQKHGTDAEDQKKCRRHGVRRERHQRIIPVEDVKYQKRQRQDQRHVPEQAPKESLK